MAKRKMKKGTGKRKKKAEWNIQGEIVALLIMALGFLMGISFFTSAAGVFGNYFKDICMGLLGVISYALPLIVTFYGIHFIIKKGYFDNTYKYVLGLVSLTLFSAIIQIFHYDPDSQLSIGESFKTFYVEGMNGVGGGVIGGAIAEPIINMFGVWGASIILLFCILILLMIITQISVFSIVAYISNVVKKACSYIYEQLANSLKEAKLNKKEGSRDLEEELIEIQQFVQEDVAATKEESITIFDHQIEEEKGISPEPMKKNTEKKVSVNSEIDVEIDNEINLMNEHVNYVFPPVELLSLSSQSSSQKKSTEDLRKSAKKLADTLKSFGVDVKVLQVSRGPSVTRYELQPSAGVKVSKIVNLADDIALNLAAPRVRIEAPIPGKAAIGIEVPNKEIMSVNLREVIESDEFSNHLSNIAFSIGKDIAGKPIVGDISRMPHLLIAGATGSGKSVCINTLITSILYKAHPDEVKLVLIDPKVVELGVYNGIPHLLIPVVTDPKKAAGALNWAVQEMVKRYKLFAENNVRDLKGYNHVAEETLPQIVIIIDELSDLMMIAPNDVENSICRLAQMARAAGMHLVIATQRPSVDVITGVIKANIPSRISFAVSSQVDSRTILDMAGAEKLLGRGDMLYYPVGSAKPVRLQGSFISDKEVENIVKYIKDHSGVNYHEDVIELIENESENHTMNGDESDELLPTAIELVVESGQASISMLQRRLRVGYARAARIVDQMESRGIIGGFEGSKPRQVLITKEQYQEMIMSEGQSTVES